VADNLRKLAEAGDGVVLSAAPMRALPFVRQSVGCLNTGAFEIGSKIIMCRIDTPCSEYLSTQHRNV
jgi:hypothetical protein